VEIKFETNIQQEEILDVLNISLLDNSNGSECLYDYEENTLRFIPTKTGSLTLTLELEMTKLPG